MPAARSRRRSRAGSSRGSGARSRSTSAALEDILLRVSDFVAATPEVREMDINPIFAYPDGALAVDARVILGE